MRCGSEGQTGKEDRTPLWDAVKGKVMLEVNLSLIHFLPLPTNREVEEIDVAVKIIKNKETHN